MEEQRASRRIGLGWVLLLACPALSGCIVGTAVDVATMPIRAASQTADWLTTSQSEADRNYGRKMRKKEAREGRALRKQQQAAVRQARRDRDD